jgi:hypothetical protein
MSYEIPLPMPYELQKKPIRNATELHRYLEKCGLRPAAVVVDNANAKVVVHFVSELSEGERKLLYGAVMEFYRKWIGVEK